MQGGNATFTNVEYDPLKKNGKHGMQGNSGNYNSKGQSGQNGQNVVPGDNYEVYVKLDKTKQFANVLVKNLSTGEDFKKILYNHIDSSNIIIDAYGGSGGSGGFGGRGYDSTQGAGDGGNGGSGGDGANGGKVIIYIENDAKLFIDRIEIKNNGGKAGAAGLGGMGGSAGGVYNGPDGRRGADGSSGRLGINGPEPIIIYKTIDLKF